MEMSVSQQSMFCTCGMEVAPLIRTYRNMYGICRCGNLIKVKRRLWFVHYFNALKEFYYTKTVSYLTNFSNRQDHGKNNQVCFL